MKQRLDLKEHVDYGFLDFLSEENQGVPIVVMSGKYKGIVVQFGSLNVTMLHNDPRMTFEFVVHQNPNNVNIEEEDFQYYLGELLVCSFLNTHSPGLIDDARENNTKEPVN